jgi:hypothetical protein
MPDNFVGFVTCQPFRSNVPGAYNSINVEHKDRVVTNLLHEQSVTFFLNFSFWAPAKATFIHMQTDDRFRAVAKNSRSGREAEFT